MESLWRTPARRVILLALASFAVACARPDRLELFAAASLRDAFADLGKEFEASHPGVEVALHTAGSQELRVQLEQGAEADLFASADEPTMQALVDAHRVESPVFFAENEPVVALTRSAAERVRTLEDLPRLDRIVLAVPEAPIGRYASQLIGTLRPELRQALEARVVSREFNTRQVLTKIRLGEADAGVVYRSDIRDVPDVSVLELPPERRVIARYPIAVVAGARHVGVARAWIEQLLSPAGQAALERAGLRRMDGRR